MATPLQNPAYVSPMRPAPTAIMSRPVFVTTAFNFTADMDPFRVGLNSLAANVWNNANYTFEQCQLANIARDAASGFATTAGQKAGEANTAVTDVRAALAAIKAGPVASVMGRTGVVVGLTETSTGARRDKSQLMADAPRGQWAIYNDSTGAGSDWPTNATNGFWAVLTYGESARAVQQATQVFRGGQGGWTYQRTLHDASWSDWDRVFTGSTLIERADVRPGTVSGTITVNAATASLCIFAPSAATTVNITAPRDVGDQLTIRIYFPVAASIAFGSNVVPPLGGSLPAVAAGNILTLTFITDNNKSKWFMFVAGVHKA